MRAATPEKGTNAEGKPLHPVCQNAAGRIHLVATIGHKWLTCVILGYPITLDQLDVYEHRLTELVLTDHQKKTSTLYPLKRAVKMFRRFAREGMGITDGAAAVLKSLTEEMQ